MRLSDIKGDRVFDVVADIIAPIANIASDKEAMKLFERLNCPKGVTPTQFMLSRIKNGMPTLIRKHKNDLKSILAALEGVSVKEYCENLTMGKFTADIVELFTDESFAELFTDAQMSQSISAESPLSAPENTEAH